MIDSSRKDKSICYVGSSFYNICNISREALRNNRLYGKQQCSIAWNNDEEYMRKWHTVRAWRKLFSTKKEMCRRDDGLPCWCYHYDCCTLFSLTSFYQNMFVLVCFLCHMRICWKLCHSISIITSSYAITFGCWYRFYTHSTLLTSLENKQPIPRFSSFGFHRNK